MISHQPVPGIPGAVIRQVEQVPELEGAIPAGHGSEALPGILRFTVPNAGAFLVRDTGVIEFAPQPDADPGLIDLFLHGTARGALIHMRGELPLHAATYVPPQGGDALAICGATGAGKSTLGAQLSRRGWKLVADDTTRVTWDGSAPIAWPSRDSVKLWRDACEAAGLDVSKLEPVARNMEKYYVVVPAIDAPARLGTILELVEEAPEKELTLGGRMALITRHTYRPHHIVPLGTQTDHVRIVAQTASAARLLQLAGKSRHAPGPLADLVESLVQP